jgi:hypothetical protein
VSLKVCELCACSLERLRVVVMCSATDRDALCVMEVEKFSPDVEETDDEATSRVGVGEIIRPSLVGVCEGVVVIDTDVVLTEDRVVVGVGNDCNEMDCVGGDSVELRGVTDATLSEKVRRETDFENSNDSLETVVE